MTETTIKKDPFDFLFFYEFEDGREEDALLVGGDDPSTASPLHLAIGIKDAKQIVISPIPDVTIVSSSNYHFKLQFTAGILLQPEQITVEGDDWGLEVEEDTILYLLWKGEEITLDGTNSLELMLNGVMATLALAVRTSQTNVTLSWGFKRGSITVIDVTPMAAPGDSNPFNNSATEILEMIKRQGAANIPLYVGFFSSNRVLNTDNQESNLKLRITNTSESPITFNYEGEATKRSELVVALEVGDAETVPWALGTADQVNDVVVTIAGDKWQPAGPTNKGSTLEWTFSPKSADISLAAKETLVIELSKIVTAHPTGTANLYLRYKYLPGYQDGEFICPIEKAPLVFPEEKVGIGTTTPKQTLHVAGDYYGKGYIWLYANEGDGKSGTVYIQARDDSKLSDIGLSFRTQTGSKLNDVMHLDKSGNVGIGTTEPSAKLHVDGGNAIFQGGNVGIGTTSPSQKLHVNGGNAIFQGGNVGIGTENPSEKLHVNGGNAIFQGGNVGIGTTSPSQKLHVDGGNAIFSNDVNISGNLNFGKRNGQMLNLYGDAHGIGIQGSTTYFRSSNNFAWFKGGSHSDGVADPGGGRLQMVLDGNGNVGIGTNEPKGKLDVHGSIKINGGPAMKLIRYTSKGFNEGGTLEANKHYNTGMNSTQWVAVIAGFHIDAGDESPINGASAYMEIVEGYTNWHLFVDGLGRDDDWVIVNVLFIRKEFF